MKILGYEISAKKGIIVVFIIFAIIIVGIIGYAIDRSGKKIIIEAKSEKDSKEKIEIGKKEEDTLSDSTEKFEHIEEINIYVVGCVEKPGIVTIKKGDMINDAIIAAGGVKDNADLQNINLVYKLTGNVMLRIRSVEEVSKEPDGGSEAGSGVKIIKDSGGAVVENSKSSGLADDGKVNINTASGAELESLPGIGKATAKDILAYREKNGDFKSIEDIKKVPGIKEGRFNSIKDYITVDWFAYDANKSRQRLPAFMYLKKEENNY